MIAVNIDFDELLDEAVSKHDKERQPRTLYVSEIPYCMRKTFFSYHIPKPAPKELQRIFFVGDLLHEKITEMLKSKYHVTSEQSVVIYLPDVDFRLSGRYDDLVYTPEGKVLIEKKSTSSLPSHPLEHHLMQANIYMRALGINSAQLVYIEKSTSSIRSFTLIPNQKIFMDAISRARKIARMIISGRVPEAEAKLGNKWECNYCQFKDLCNSYGLKQAQWRGVLNEND